MESSIKKRNPQRCPFPLAPFRIPPGTLVEGRHDAIFAEEAKSSKMSVSRFAKSAPFRFLGNNASNTAQNGRSGIVKRYPSTA